MDEPMGATLYRASKLKQAHALENRDGKAAASGAKVGKNFKAKVLGEEGSRLLIQDVFGEQDWVPAEALSDEKGSWSPSLWTGDRDHSCALRARACPLSREIG
jgi:hypothetical protein